MPLNVVIVDPGTEPGARLRAGLKGLEIEALVLERAQQPLDHDVVHPASLAVHGDLDFGILELLDFVVPYGSGHTEKSLELH